VDRAVRKAKGKSKKVKGRTGSRPALLKILSLTFAFCLLPFAFSCTLKANKGGVPAEARATVETVGEDIAGGRYEKIYNEAAEEWRRATTPEESEATFRKLKERLGDVRTRSFHTATEQDGTGGHMFVITYATQFDRADGMETFTLVERDGRWQLARYFVNSDALK
jgi:hypothetical protein